MAKPVDEESKDTILQQVNTAQSILMTPDLFEKLYLTPHTAAKGELRSILGNPSPLSVPHFPGDSHLPCSIFFRFTD